MKLGYCSGNGSSIYPFNEIFSDKIDMTKADWTQLSDLDAVIFWGGTDIWPGLYGEKAHPKNQNQNLFPSVRDKQEWLLMEWCGQRKIPMIGICRGAQMLCAFAGGKLHQHVEGHNGGGHFITTIDDYTFLDASDHHQAMDVKDVAHTPIAQCNHIPEIVYFPEINGLAIQGHPEWCSDNSEYKQYCVDLVVDLMNGDLK